MGSNGKKKQKDGKKSGKSRGGDGYGGRGGGRVREQPKAITDERFAAAQSDPRFMEAPKKKSKVEIDSRFQRMFTDRSFASSKSNIDKRGKRKNGGKNGDADSSLGHYYRLEQKRKRVEEDEDEEDVSESGSESDKSIASIEEEDGDDSASTSTVDSDAESLEDDDEEDDFMKPEENIPEIEEETRRLAVVNLDWLHVRAVDLYMLLGSFLPKGGRIVSVAVYPTEFGLQRMEEESVHGPVGLYDNESEQDNEDDENDIDNKKLRSYELSRLKYYYAVVECDSIATADYLYQACDGVEFERSSNKLDLRFIPDSMEFKHQPRDVANEAPANYEGLDFQTQALQQSNIQLTWDEDEPTRSKTLKMLQSEQPAESEYNDILASDESDTDEDDNADGMEDKLEKKRKRRDKYLALSKSGDGSDEDNEEDNDQDMEVTFNPGLEDLNKRMMEKKDKKSETVWEANLRKGKEKKKARKSKYSSDDESSDTDRELGEQPDDFFLEEPSDNQVKSNKKGGNSRHETAKETEASRAELELLVAGDEGVDNNLKGFNLKPKKRKGKKGKEADAPDEEKIPTFDYSDPRFSVIIDDPRFALDPTDPQFKRSAAYVRQVAKKLNVSQAAHLLDSVQASEMHEDETDKSDKLAKGKQESELSSLVRSIKMNSKQVPLSSQAKVHRKHRKVHK